MDRRKFVKQSAMFTAGMMAAPHILYGCKKSILDWEGTYTGKVIIVGAGAAGIYAGYLLNELGIDFQILEAAGRYGGRMGKKTDFADFTIDLGAEWIHGQKSHAKDLADQFGHEHFRDKADTMFWYSGSKSDSMPSHLADISETLESTYDEKSMWQIATENGASAADYNIVCAMAGEYGATPENLNVGMEQRHGENWNSGSKDYRFPTSYFDLIDTHLAEPIKDKIQVNTPITNIDYTGSTITLTDASSNTYDADKVILALPLPILKDGDITFAPALPTTKTDAFNELEMEPGMKLFIKFSTKFYDDGMIGGDVCPAYVNNSWGKPGSDNVLLCFLMGDKSKAITDMGETAAIDAILAELDSMYDGQATPAYQSHHMQDWYSEPFVRGAYSYAGLNSKTDSRNRAAETVSDQLYWAGEFTHFNGHHQTVQGALESGYREVERILEWIDNQ